MGKPVALVALPLADDLIERVSQTCDVVVCGREAGVPDAASLAAQLPQADGVLTTVRSRYHQDLLQNCPRLKVISNFAVGYDNVDVAAATRSGVLVCNTPGVLDRAVAEVTLGLILMTGRNMRDNDFHVRSGAWASGAAPLASDVAGKVLGLLGMGRIGKVVARSAQALGMKVMYYKPTRDFEIEAAGIAEYHPRDELIRQADFLSVHMPLDEHTRGSIGRAEFDAMKSTSYFINTARGAIVDEEALIEALRSRAIAGAGLDVMTKEPIGPDHPLCALPNVVLQPHIGSATVETRRAMIELAVENLLNALSGKRPAAMVNPEVWPFSTRGV